MGTTWQRLTLDGSGEKAVGRVLELGQKLGRRAVNRLRVLVDEPVEKLGLEFLVGFADAASVSSARVEPRHRLARKRGGLVL